MPNPRNRLKLTGDTHLPDVGDEGDAEAEVLRFEPAEDAGAGAGTRETAAPTELASSSADYLDAAREQVRQRPVLALAGAFALGYLFARI